MPVSERYAAYNLHKLDFSRVNPYRHQQSQAVMKHSRKPAHLSPVVRVGWLVVQS